MIMKLFNNIYKNKTVLVTGHTGFKGSWLSLWLVMMGAKVIGISNKVLSKPSHFEVINLKKKIKHINLDIRDYKRLSNLFKKYKPDFVFHLAAQSLVKQSYLNPLETWSTNTIGTLNVLESLRPIKKKTYVVIITSDKSYKNIEILRGYREKDSLGGKDPYSASKGAAEFAIQSYIKSFFSHKKNNIFIGIARAGNVIGGGDWSKDRIIPDCAKSYSKNKRVIIRSPKSTRPWQHVLEVIYGYLTLASKLYKNENLHGEAFNFGPSKQANYKVIYLLQQFKKYWSNFNWKIIKSKKNFSESKLLKLNSDKAKKKLNWQSKLSINETIKLVANWYSFFYKKNDKDLYTLSIKQIHFYIGKIK
jgi:CDP-glucose 4,6-dehydratase